jgi:hypothetical protein
MSAKDMSGMAPTFTTSTRVTLWFTDWTTTTTATYVLTILFLFLLGILNRFLGALKSQLERKWKRQREAQGTPDTEKLIGRIIQGHARQWSRALRPQFQKQEELDWEEIEPLSPAPNVQHAGEKGVENDLSASLRFWVANAPWNVKRDGISAALEFTRALIGYILYVIFHKSRTRHVKLTR